MFVRAYVKSDEYWKAVPAIQRSVKDALDKAGVLRAVTRQAAVDRGLSGNEWPAKKAPDIKEPDVTEEAA
jgi:hypothetical protein